MSPDRHPHDDPPGALSTVPPGAPGSAGSAGSGALEAIYGRRAVRAYTSEPVARELMESLLEAAVQAPSAVNVQPWAFVVIQDPTRLERYAQEARALLLAQPTVPEVARAFLPELAHLRRIVGEQGYRLFHGAPSLVVIYATAPGGLADCYLAAQNLMLAAHALGLATCPIGLATPLFDLAATKEELGIPAPWHPALPLVVGHPAGPTPATTRRPPETVAWL